MTNPVLLGIAENVVFLLAVALVFDLVAGAGPVKDRRVRDAGIGVVLGLIAVGTMLTSLRYEPGLIFDARSVVLGVGGLLFGLAAALPAMLVAGAYRILQGGQGMWTGLWVILASGGLGVVWARVRRGPLRTLRFTELYAFGLVLHIVVLGLMFTLPGGRAFEIVPAIGPPFLIFYPLATVLLGLHLLRNRRRERTAARLVESEARYRSLFEESRSVLLVVDPDDGRIINANQAAAEFYGHDASTLQQMQMSEINSLDPEVMQTELDRCMRGERKRVLYEHRLADGSVRRVEVHCGPIPIEGRVLVLFTVQDVTDRHETRERLRRQGELLRLRSAALEAAANPIVITDLDGHIESVNPAFTRLTGYSADEALGRQPGELVRSGEHDDDFYRGMWDTILAGEVWQGEMVNRKKDGTLYHEEQTITPVRNDAGDLTHFVAIKQDRTERRELQQQLLHAQKMEAVGQLAGGVAHDFNNLLTVINGTTQLALEDLAPDEPLRAELGEILDAGTRASRLTRQLLTFSRRDSVRSEVVDLNHVIESTGSMLQRLLNDLIRLDLRLCGEPARVLADPGRLEQIIVNLVLNARDAMPDGGRITVETRIRGAHRALLRVSDTGTGMPPDVRERIFEPFFTTKEAGKGTGLGLATVYGIVKQAGGEIAVESEPGRGTRFEILLPLVEHEGASGPASNGTPAETSAPASSPGSASPRARILVVDDDHHIQRIAVRILERDGFDVVGAASGPEALEQIGQSGNRFDLILTDVIMPDMTGPELVARVRRDHPGVRVLFSSGYTDSQLEAQGLDPAEHLFLAKPFTVQGLKDRVQDALRAG